MIGQVILFLVLATITFFAVKWYIFHGLEKNT